MIELNRFLAGILLAAIVGFANSATGGEANVTCPTQVNTGQSVMVNLILTNGECFPASPVRIISSVVGNASDDLAGVGIFGPVVADTVVVPAGSNRSCGCTLNYRNAEWCGRVIRKYLIRLSYCRF